MTPEPENEVDDATRIHGIRCCNRGGGPAGLSAAIRLKQLAGERNQEVSVCLIEKAAEIGGHILSGAIMDPRALCRLSGLEKHGCAAEYRVSEDRFLMLTEGRDVRIPNWMLPDCLHNDGNYIIGLAESVPLARQQAEDLGVEIYPGFAGAEMLYGADGSVKGVATGDMGRLKDGNEGPSFQPGMELHARYTLFAEGCRGRLGKQIEERFGLCKDASRRSTASASRNCGRFSRRSIDGVSSSIPAAGRSTTRRMAAGSCTTWRTISSRSDW